MAKITVGELAVKVDLYHEAVTEGLGRIEAQLKTINGQVDDHETRISTVEGKQSIVVKIIVASIGVSGVGGAAIGFGTKAAGLW